MDLGDGSTAGSPTPSCINHCKDHLRWGSTVGVGCAVELPGEVRGNEDWTARQFRGLGPELPGAYGSLTHFLIRRGRRSEVVTEGKGE